MRKTRARQATTEEPWDRKRYEARMAAIQAEMNAQYDAMTEADFEYIETTIDALRKRYPALHIEVGRW